MLVRQATQLESILRETAPYREDEEKVSGVVVADKGQFTKQNMDAVEINAPDPPQNEESIVSTVEICRVCLLGNMVMRDLFVQNEVDSLSAKVMSFANVKITPGDGLPARVCCMCADKLESAYELKLQVEQADSVLRERFDSINIKEELFFNEVEVHLDGERTDGIGDIQVQVDYDTTPECANLKSEDEKSTLLKDQLLLLQVEKFAEQEQLPKEQDELQVINEEINAADLDDGKDSLKLHNMTVTDADAIPTDEHDYIMQQSCMLPTGTEHLQEDLQEEHMQEEHLQEEHLQEEHMQEEHLQEEHLQDHLQEIHLQEDHLQEDHLHEDHLHEDHLQEDHLQEHHLHEDHLQEEHLQEEHLQEEHLQEEHLHEEHLQEQLQDEHLQADHLQEQLQEEHLQDEHLHEHLQEEHLQEQLQEHLQEEHLQEHLQEQLQEEHLQEQLQQEHLHEQLQEQLQDHPEEESHEHGHQEDCPQETPQREARRSKRKLARRTFTTDRDSDEENYFENLNLSSRLKKVQADKSEKVFFMCYLCDKQFLSKSVLKEHMHSHEEVRRALSLKKTPEKLQKAPSSALPTKTPPSGKRANKCPYCGKEYLYIISFSKHLKQHEREREESKGDPMPLEISFHEDEHSLDFEQSQYLEAEGKRRSWKEDTNEDDDTEEQSGNERRKKARIEEFVCNKCSEKFSTRRALRKHTETHVSLKCSVCDEEFDTLEKLRNHRAKHVVEGVLTDQDLEEDAKIVEKGDVEYEDGEKDEEEDEEDEEMEEEGRDKWAEKDLKCPNCPMMYSHKKSLSRHMETHSGTKYSCKVCCQQFTRKDHLRRHSEHHGRVKSYKCSQCNKTFGNELTLRNHLIATNHKTFIHGQEYDPNKRIKRHAAKAAQKIIDKIKTEDGLEDYDDDDNNDPAELDNRYSRKRDGMPKKYNCKKDLECATCNKRCSSKQSLSKHMEQHVKDEKAEKAEKLDKNRKQSEKKEQRGLVDDDDDDDNSDFESGLDWPMDNHECTTCKKRYSTKKSLLRHQLLHEEPNFECDICNVKFYRKDKLKAHYDKCSEKNPDQVRKCNICGDSFENNEMLREHRSKHVTEGILTEEDLRDIEPRPEEKKQGEKIARKRRTDIVGLECTECNKQYTSRKGLLRHIQVHEGKKYHCDICPKKFYRREHLKIHVAKHNMIRPYKCTRCTKRFIKEEQLTNHLSKHDRTFKKNKETESSKRFLCEICSKSFTQSTTLIAHLRAHNGIKPYVCEVCSRPFTTNAYLKMHMRTHTQERPYICQYCSRAFARADTLANHLTSHTGEAKYHCKYCPKNFRRLKSLKEHVFIHTGQRPYACPTCDRRFNNNGSRYAHSKRCKQNLLQNQTRTQTLTQVQAQPQQRMHQTLTQAQVVKAQNIKTITIARQDPVQQVVQHQEILMPLILPLTVTLTDVGEEVILPEGTKIFTTS